MFCIFTLIRSLLMPSRSDYWLCWEWLWGWSSPFTWEESSRCRKHPRLTNLLNRRRSRQQAPTPEPAKQPAGTATATFGNGCFWCTEAVFQRLKGVKTVVSGYSGGSVKNPTYQSGLYRHDRPRRGDPDHLRPEGDLL